MKARTLGTAIAVASSLFVLPTAAHAAEHLLSQGRPVTASSSQPGPFSAAQAVDGDPATRWASDWSDAQWLQVDLGSTSKVRRIVLSWEAAYASGYKIQISSDALTWTDLATVADGDGGSDSLEVSGSGRYVRLLGQARATPYGYSLFEFQVLGKASGDAGPVGGGDLGPNVLVFDPSMPAADVQARLDAVFTAQESAQFGEGRYAALFRPGSYDVDAKVGFYTSVHGLGKSPDDVTLKGVSVDAQWFGGNATQNFWRSTENLSVAPPSGTNRWAVAQAAPFRRMHIKGGLNLAPSSYGWASGGYIADSKVDGLVGTYSQQQWYTRDSSIGSMSNAVWNMVFSGVQGAPAQSFPDPPYTTLDTTPVSREKPYLYAEADGSLRVFVPAKRRLARGTSWGNGPEAGGSLSLDRFFVARPGVSAATINAALAKGLHLLFTPGIYHLDSTIQVNDPDTVVLGLGLATLVPDGGVTAMKVADVDGVKLAGFLIDAGTTNSPALLEIGPPGASADHSDDPISMQDVFVRIGGQFAGKATTSVVVNSDDTIIDHTWIWRADHGDGVGWETNRADYGLVVNGDDVLATGLFVEHFNRYDVTWNGERGRTIFFQNEKSYDAPDQASIQNGSVRGYAAYKVADTVRAHEAWGLGSYCYFNVDPSIVQDRGFEVPVTPGVRLHDVLVISLGGNGQFAHVVNDTGAPTQGTSTVPSQVVGFP
ncbi:discoidin domain-containing protein [Actinocorallia longicatena]|uniref:Discoidin domain-containing protein n=1 Tax=Actinocorallia longicatena TaxID=111803 RepID=A0ABP6Q7Z1_9ACTN